ncbi:unnamed protein product [marine sediment metagenome]|uniref:Helix-turn-helix domain-containing protein n=1 Tax=marine sediment metagenome TaxID=412755 RepID=X1NBH7_9ZZZZ
MPTFDDLPLVLTPRETAKILRCGKSTVYEQIRCGKIAHLRLGRRILVPRASLLKMLESAGDGQRPEKLAESREFTTEAKR